MNKHDSRVIKSGDEYIEEISKGIISGRIKSVSEGLKMLSDNMNKEIFKDMDKIEFKLLSLLGIEARWNKAKRMWNTYEYVDCKLNGANNGK